MIAAPGPALRLPLDSFSGAVMGGGSRDVQMMLIAFLVTFGIVRGLVHLIRRGVTGKLVGNIVVGSVHVHHLVPGIFLLLITGFASVGFGSELPEGLWWLLPTMFGIGAALVLDEFALWLNLRDVYWSKEGRRSIDAVIIFATLLALVAMGLPFWIDLLIGDPHAGAIAIGYHLLALTCTAVCLAKGKYISAAIGFFFWPVGLVGAVRLARPRSRWARRRYGPELMARAHARYDRDDRPAPVEADPLTP